MNKKFERIFNLVVGMGEILIECDAEILRVIDTMNFSAEALGIDELDTFIITNGIFVTARMDGETLAKTKQIRTHEANLGKIDAVNALSRDIVAGKTELAEAERRLKDISQMNVWPAALRYLGAAIGCGALTVIYEGTYRDALASFFIAMGIRLLLSIAGKRQINRVIVNLFASILISLAARTCTFAGLADNTDKIIIGSIMLLVPGILLTNGIRDITNNDYLSGIIRVIEAILIASSIAVGVGMVFLFF
ncbi:MAG: threonine/serine exporter family protein [Eubacteriales bacterium]|nr:threonine/serine exporter family protein [Eubacteriales bacterium]